MTSTKTKLLLVAASILGTQAIAAPKLKIGFILATMQEERYQKDKKIFEEAAKALGAEVVFASCNNNEQTQATQVDNVLSKGVQALVIQPVNGDAASGLVKQAHEDKVPVVAYDRLIKDTALEAYITKDSYKIGVMQAEAAAKASQGKGNVIILMGQAGHSVAETITKGNLDTLAKYPGMKVIVKQYHEAWSSNRAMQTVENALTKYKNDVQVVLANNSGMARGAIQALDEQKLAGKVFVAGSDADLAAVRDIVAGKQQFEVLAPIDEIARKAAETAVALALKKEVKFDAKTNNGKVDVSTVTTSVLPIDKSTIDKNIIQSGFHAKDAVYKGLKPTS